ncbi:MAG: cobyric acid synthase, partial [Proteobacteria bacterium]|nr:cobyric acid synthase [Pseudomonadota bacterium]
MTKVIMIQGSGSNVGKSLIVAGLCRLFTNKGLTVRPFKPQNMSNNAAVTSDGGEIGRAQALQALACKIDPHTDMNPILLKPESDFGSQVIVHGKRYATLKARDYLKEKPILLKKALESFYRLSVGADLILIEGAGSPAETNLRSADIANMGFAECVETPVVIVGDINRGGVIAQLVGTNEVINTQDKERIVGFLINKFRGDPTLFEDGILEILQRTKWTPLGVIPWFEPAWKLPAEDLMDIKGSSGGVIKIVVPKLRRISNFDDLDPLRMESNVTVEIIEAGRPLPADATLILIPGSKSTISDLNFIKEQGWDIDIYAHVRRGGRVLGICGGYQILGKFIEDPNLIEGNIKKIDGLGLLNVTTTMFPEKKLSKITGNHIQSGMPIVGYEMHIGVTIGEDCLNPLLLVNESKAGATSPSGKVYG